MTEGRSKRAIVVGALLVIAAVVIVVQFSRLGQGVQPGLPADAPPAGVSVFYVREPGNPHGLVAYDWSGARRGRVTLPTWVEISRLRPAPDGSAFLIDPSTPGDYAAYFDRGGRILFETDDPAFSSQAWADDSTHICVLADATDGAVLLTRSPGRGDRKTQTRLSTGYSVAGCSLRTDIVVLASPNDIQILRLSTGRALRTFSTSLTAVASADAAYIAISSSGAEPGLVYKTTDLSEPVALPRADLQPLAFSGDDSLLLVGPASRAGAVQAIAWRTGKVAWSYDPRGASVDSVQARPSAGDFVVYLSSGPVLLRRDGKVGTIG